MEHLARLFDAGRDATARAIVEIGDADRPESKGW
jgi:hypothetical protein